MYNEMPVERFIKRRLWWKNFAGGRSYPFQLRAAKAEVLHRIGRWKELTVLLEQDLNRSQEYEVLSYQGRCLLKLGILDAQRGNFAGAGGKISKAFERYKLAGDGSGIYECRSAQTKIAINMEEYQKAKNLALELLSEARQKRDLKSESEMLNNLGLVCLRTGRGREALTYFSQKLELAKTLGDGGGRAQALGNIGCVYFSDKLYAEAAACDRESIEICRRMGDIYTEYFALYNLAKACEGMGLAGEALAHYRRDLEMARQLGDWPGEQDILEDIARVTTDNIGE